MSQNVGKKKRFRGASWVTMSMQAAAGCVSSGDYGEVAPRRGGLLLGRDARGVDHLLFGRAALAYADAVGESKVKAAIIPLDRVQDAGDLELLDAAKTATLQWQVECAAALRRLDLAFRDVAGLMGIPSVPDIHRLLRFSTRPARLQRRAIETGLSRGHLRHLSSLPDNEFEEWVETVRRGKLSVHKLGAVIRGDAVEEQEEVATQQSAFEIQLGKDLGTHAVVRWPAEEARRSVNITWHTAEDLAGILQKLGAASSTGAGDLSLGKVVQRRRLTLQLRTLDEMETVLGSLGAER